VWGLLFSPLYLACAASFCNELLFFSCILHLGGDGLCSVSLLLLLLLLVFRGGFCCFFLSDAEGKKGRN
jgi:hypothetical protein